MYNSQFGINFSRCETPDLLNLKQYAREQYEHTGKFRFAELIDMINKELDSRDDVYYTPGNTCKPRDGKQTRRKEDK